MGNIEIPEEAKEIDEGLSNKVYSHEGKIYKVYRFFPIPGLYASFLELLRGRIIFYSRQRRIRNEVKISDLVGTDKVQTAEVIDLSGNTVVFGEVPGVSGFIFLDQSSEEESVSFGEDIKEFLKDTHDKDIALKDARLSNFIVDENKVYSIDHEYASLEAGKVFKILDELTVISSARQTENYHSFRKGFRPHRYAEVLSIFTAFYHILLFNRESSRFKNLLRSLRSKQN